MDWETAKQKVWGSFDVLLSEEDQIHAIEDYGGKFVEIHSMDDFDSFCKKNYPDRYLDIVSFVLNRRRNARFDTNDFYFAWYMMDEEFISCNCITDFVEDVDQFIKMLILCDTEILRKMGFSELILGEMKQALKAEEEM